MTILNRQGKKKPGPYPKPDRSLFEPKTNRDDPIYEIDLGWAEDELRDGRPYRAEFWLWDHLLFITFFFSTIGLERASQEDLFALLVEEGLICFRSREGSAEKMKDSSENEMWSVCVSLRGRDGTLASTGICFTPYRSDWSLETEKDLAGTELPRLACPINGGFKTGRPQ